MEYLDPALRDAANQIAAGIVFLENDDRLSQFDMAAAGSRCPRTSHSTATTAPWPTCAGQSCRTPRSSTTTRATWTWNCAIRFSPPTRTSASRSSSARDWQTGRIRSSRSSDLTAQYAVPAARPDQRGAARSQPAPGLMGIPDRRIVQVPGRVDHLLFIVVLALPYRRVRDLVGAVAAFALRTR